MTQSRLQNSDQFWLAPQQTLQRAKTVYGVPEEIVRADAVLDVRWDRSVAGLPRPRPGREDGRSRDLARPRFRRHVGKSGDRHSGVQSLGGIGAYLCNSGRLCPSEHCGSRKRAIHWIDRAESGGDPTQTQSPNEATIASRFLAWLPRALMVH